MKRILSIIILAMTSFICMAQEHMTFKGIPIDGDLNSFVDKLEELGFSLDREFDDTVLTGEFAGKSDCKIIICSTKLTNTVCQVGVAFPDQTSWIALKIEYDELLRLFTQKYGKPYQSQRYFDKPFYDGCGNEVRAVDNLKCHWSDLFSTDQGRITLTLSPGSRVGYGCVVIFYHDKINMLLNDKEISNDL